MELNAAPDTGRGGEERGEWSDLDRSTAGSKGNMLGKDPRSNSAGRRFQVLALASPAKRFLGGRGHERPELLSRSMAGC